MDRIPTTNIPAAGEIITGDFQFAAYGGRFTGKGGSDYWNSTDYFVVMSHCRYDLNGGLLSNVRIEANVNTNLIGEIVLQQLGR